MVLFEHCYGTVIFQGKTVVDYYSFSQEGDYFAWYIFRVLMIFCLCSFVILRYTTA